MSKLNVLSANIATAGLKDLSGLRVTFINMPLRESAAPVVAPEGPAILAAILRNQGTHVSILDLNAYRIKDERSTSRPNGRYLSLSEVEDYFSQHLNIHGDQDLVGFSGIITSLRWQEHVAKIVRRLQPDTFIVSGNGLATEIKRGLFNWIPELDAIVRSEGDDVILKIASDVQDIKQHGFDLALSKDLVSEYYVGEYNNRHRFVYEGGRPTNLDAIPGAAWDLLESDPFGKNILETYILSPIWGLIANNSSAAPFTMKRSLNTVSSRGCPYECAFCYRGAFGERNYGIRSAESIADQMKLYKDTYGVDFIGYLDDNFAVNKKRMHALPSAFQQVGADVRWGTHARMDEADQRLFPMSEAGCIYMGFGAESAHEKTLTRMHKGGFILRNGVKETIVAGRPYYFPQTMIDGIKNCHRAAIHANCTWIMGYPGETLDELKTSVAFILWQQEIITSGQVENNNGYTAVREAVNRKMFTATAYPGTEMFNEPPVRKILTNNFGITFDNNNDPICDENFHNYVLELDDATKVLKDKDGNPINFGEMPLNDFLTAREFIDDDNVEKILEM